MRILIAAGVTLLTAVAAAQETTRVSVDSSGAQGNDLSALAAISADGRMVAFTSVASNLVPGDTNNSWDIFVHDRSTGITERISVDSAGVEANGLSTNPRISADGLCVTFTSYATNLVSGDTNGQPDAFVHDLATGYTERVSVDSSGAEGNDFSFAGGISADGQLVAFFGDASNLVSGDLNDCEDVFIHDRSTGATVRISVDSSGSEGNGSSHGGAFSADGTIFAFDSYASNLVSGDTNGVSDTFVHDRSTGMTERVSVGASGAEGNRDSGGYSISADGKIVVFSSGATNLVPGDNNSASDVFVHDRSTGLTERVSVDTSGAEGNKSSYGESISADGRVMAFVSIATNLVTGDTNQQRDAFVHDRSTGLTERVSVDTNGQQGDGDAPYVEVSADGQLAWFQSLATNLVAGDTNGKYDVFVKELCSTAANWSNYGAGFPGTYGIPSFTSQQNPVLGTTITLALGNSLGSPTMGLLFVGFQRTTIHSGWGGDLLVVPAVVETVSFSYGYDSFTGGIPNDFTLCGVTLDLQAFEGDPGAARGVSFTPGLELVLGH